MNREDIIRMAREAGWIIRDDLHYMDHQAIQDALLERIERFFQAAYAAGAAAERKRLAWTQEHWTEYEHNIAAAEREACAKVCDERLGPTATDFYGKTYAAAIRARSKQ